MQIGLQRSMNSWLINNSSSSVGLWQQETGVACLVSHWNMISGNTYNTIGGLWYGQEPLTRMLYMGLQECETGNAKGFDESIIHMINRNLYIFLSYWKVKW